MPKKCRRVILNNILYTKVSIYSLSIRPNPSYAPIIIPHAIDTLINLGAKPRVNPGNPSLVAISYIIANVLVEAAGREVEEGCRGRSSACRRVLATSNGLVRVAAICKCPRCQTSSKSEERNREKYTHHSTPSATHERNPKLLSDRDIF